MEEPGSTKKPVGIRDRHKAVDILIKTVLKFYQKRFKHCPIVDEVCSDLRLIQARLIDLEQVNMVGTLGHIDLLIKTCKGTACYQEMIERCQIQPKRKDTDNIQDYQTELDEDRKLDRHKIFAKLLNQRRMERKKELERMARIKEERELQKKLKLERKKERERKRRKRKKVLHPWIIENIAEISQEIESLYSKYQI